LEFDVKFKEPNLGLVDGTVAALSERRDFGAIRVGPHFSRALEIVP